MNMLVSFMAYPDYWTCPKCGAVVSDSSYCTNCAYEPPKQGYPSYWRCPKCSAIVSNSSACTSCTYNPSVSQVVKNPKKKVSKNLFIIGSSISVGVIVLFIVLMFFRPAIETDVTVNDQVQQISDRINFVEECKPEWVCKAWGPCEGQIQRRECNDTNDCGTFYFRPEVMRLCED